MSSPLDILGIIEAFAKRYKTPQFGYNTLLSFIDRYVLENPQWESKFEDIQRIGNKALIAHLEALEQASDLKIYRKDNLPQAVFYPNYCHKKIEDAYSRMDEKPELPFPTEDSLELSIPPEEIKVIDIKADFIHWLNKDIQGQILLRINFPEGIQSLLTASNLLSSRMVLSAVQKIRHYLRDSKNMAYVRQRLTPVFRSREIAVKDMLHNIVTSPDQTAQTILEPTDFTFQLWTQLSTNIVKEYSPKSDKLAEEHGFCQAAYLIGYYNMHFRGRMQKRKDEDMALTSLIQNMRKPPYAYHISQIYEFTDEKGILLAKRSDKSRMNDYIQEKLKPAAGRDYPDILTFTTLNKEEFFILFTSVPSYISEMLLRAQKEMRDFYKRSWMIALRNDMEFITMHGDELFRKHVAQRLNEHFPQLEAIMTFPTVYFASRLDGIPGTIRGDLTETIQPNGQRLKPLEIIFKLNRTKILEDAKILLPAWMVIPGIKQITQFVRRLFLGKEAQEQSLSSSFNHEGQELVTKGKKAAAKKLDTQAKDAELPDESASSRQQQAAFRQAAKLLETEFLDGNTRLQPSMEQLAERWNQLLDITAKKNLLTDVNNLCKDYLRKQRVFNKQIPPEAQTIRMFADKLVESEHLAGIRNKKDLYRYILLYMVYVLENA